MPLLHMTIKNLIDLNFIKFGFCYDHIASIDDVQEPETPSSQSSNRQDKLCFNRKKP